MISDLFNFDFQSTIGISADIIVLLLFAVVIILLIVTIILAARSRKLRRAYTVFMEGEDGRSLEGIIKGRLDDLEQIRREEKVAESRIRNILDEYDSTFQKIGLVKYDAFEEMGGKLSFSLALLNRGNTGFVLNAVHSKEGCYTYIKEIIGGNAVVLLAEEEKEAVQQAINYNVASNPVSREG